VRAKRNAPDAAPASNALDTSVLTDTTEPIEVTFVAVLFAGIPSGSLWVTVAMSAAMPGMLAVVTMVTVAFPPTDMPPRLHVTTPPACEQVPAVVATD